MPTAFKLPDPGEGIHEAEIIEVLVAEGDRVEEGQSVAVIETDNETDRDLVVFEMVEERTAIGFAVQWPTDGVHDKALLVPRRIDFPKFLDADAKGLRVAVFA